MNKYKAQYIDANNRWLIAVAERDEARRIARYWYEQALIARAECTRLDDKSVGWKYRHDSEERWAELYFKQRNEARRMAAKYYKELQWHKDTQKQNAENLKAIAENCSE